MLGKVHRHAILDMLIRCSDQSYFCCYSRIDCTKDNVENRYRSFSFLIPVGKCDLPAPIACRKSISTTAPYLAGWVGTLRSHPSSSCLMFRVLQEYLCIEASFALSHLFVLLHPPI